MSSQDNQIVTGAAFEANKQMDYSKPKLNKSGGKSVNVINKKTGQKDFVRFE